MDMAMAWAGERRDEERMKAMLQGYRAAGGELPEDPARLLASRVNWLEWLADCIRRCTLADAHERDVGCTQAIATMEALRRDQLAAAALVRLVEQMR